jgi:NADH-quinone oxidoreductase subunit J
MIEESVFYILAVTSVACALGVVAARSPIYSAVSLVACLFAVAGIYALLAAHLLAILQILVYAGAIVVLILFVIMLLNLSREEMGRPVINLRKVAATFAVAAIVALVTGGLAASAMPARRGVGPWFGSIEGVGRVLFTEYLLPFEIVSILLLAAIIGAVVIARKEKDR